MDTFSSITSVFDADPESLLGWLRRNAPEDRADWLPVWHHWRTVARSDRHNDQDHADAHSDLVTAVLDRLDPLPEHDPAACSYCAKHGAEGYCTEVL